MINKKPRSDFDITGETQIRKKFYIYKRSAVKRGHSFDLTKEEFTNLIFGECSYCGTKPFTLYSNTPNRRNTHFIKINGIDRVNNEIGYRLDNVVSCCKHCNMMKGTLGIEFFLDKCQSIIDNLR